MNGDTPLLRHTTGAAQQRPRRFRRALAATTAALLLSACNDGLRPTLVQDPPPTLQPILELDLLAAPDGTPPLPPARQDFPLEASVDDALLAWAADRSIAYVDSCGLSDPGPGELCDVVTQRDTVRLLGPSADATWYIVTILEANSFDFGTGYRVASVEIAGQ